ncbi:60S ribosomal protein L23a [Plecturocebus cupreus]
MVKKEAPLKPPKAKVKAKALKVKKAVLKGVHSHKKIKKLCTSPTFQRPKVLQLQRQLKYPWKITFKRKKLDHYVIIKLQLTAESSIKKIKDNTLIIIVDVKANRHRIKQAEKKLYDTDVAKVNTLVGHDGQKEAYV